MKRFWTIVTVISLAFVITFASVGLVNFINNENNTQTSSIQGSVSADIFDLQTEISDLYVTKDSYLLEQADINEKLEKLESADLEADAKAKAEFDRLTVRLDELESLLTNVQLQIDAIKLQINELYSAVNGQQRNIATFTYLNDGATMSTSNSAGCPFALVTQVGDTIIYNANEHGYYLTFDTDEDVTLLISFVFTLQANSTAGTRSLTINTNSNVKIVTVSQYFEAGTLGSIVCSPVLVNLPKGQLLRFMHDTFKSGDTLYGLGSDGILRTFMTVEVVE